MPDKNVAQASIGGGQIHQMHVRLADISSSRASKASPSHVLIDQYEIDIEKRLLESPRRRSLLMLGFVDGQVAVGGGTKLVDPACRGNLAQRRLSAG